MRKDFSTPMNFPTLIGVYLAVNAVRDAYLLVDGPDCTLYKAHFIHGRHDLNSTLLRADGRHRVAFTNVCSRGVVREHDSALRRRILMLDQVEDCGLSIVTALPMCSITGVDYGRVIRSVGAELSKPVVELSPDSLIGDWIDGYAQALSGLARVTAPAPGRTRPAAAAVVGYFMDRNEADHLGNLAELRRMLAALGLETVSIWLDGSSAADLKRVEEAGLIISLPYGRAAARRLAEATGARLVETALPFGLQKTEQFMRDVAAAAGKDAEAQAFIDAELGRAAPRLRWIIPQLFLHRRTAFMGDPYLAEGFYDIAEDLGMTVSGAIIRGRAAHGGARPGMSVFHEPPVFSQEAQSVLKAPVDLLVSCWCEREERRPGAASVMEFGFPSYRHHCLDERPFLGYKGLLSFVERMADSLSSPNRRAYSAGTPRQPASNRQSRQDGRLTRARAGTPSETSSR